MNKLKLFTINATIGIISIVSCNETPKEKLESAVVELADSKDDYSEAKDNYQLEIENYRVETNEKIAKNEQKLIDYKLKVASDKTKAKLTSQEQIRELEEKNTALKNRVNSFVAGDKLNWEAFKKQCSIEMINLNGDICNVCGPQK
jgi:hypothetical protein